MQRTVLNFLILSILLVACTADVDPVPITRTQISTAVALRPSLSPTSEQTATIQSTNLPNPTQTPTILPSQTPTRTPRPSPTATATPITHYALPDWIDDPDASVLLAHIGHPENNDGVISLFNLVSNERWDLEISTNPNGHNPYWNQSEEGLFIELTYPDPSSQEPFLERIAVPDGKISHWPPRPFGWYSNDGSSLIQFIREPGNPVQAILTTSFELGQETPNGLIEGLSLSNPFNGRYDNYAEAVWSPDDAFVAVSHVSFPPTPDGTALYGLAIRTADSELFRVYDGINFTEWVPNEPLSLLHVIQVEEEFRIPCVLDVISGDNHCFNQLEVWQQERSVDLYQFTISPDGSRISFITHPDPAVCYLELFTEQISCPIEANDLIMEDHQFFAVAHDWSEDGNYIAIFMNPNGIPSHDATYNFLAVATTNGNNFQILGKTLSPAYFLQLWRPSLHDSERD